jgi:hypothetical protein
MKKRVLYILLLAGLAAAALATALTFTASAEQRTISVRLADGTVVQVTVDVPPGTPLSEIEVPGAVENQPTQPQQPAPSPAPQQQQAPEQESTTPKSTPRRPSSRGGDSQRRGGSRKKAKRDDDDEEETQDQAQPQVEDDGKRRRRGRPKETPMRNSDGTPTTSNPGFFDALPGPSTVTGVPNFVIRKFRVPVFLLPIYQAAGIQYGVRWEVLAAINEIETDYGRNLNVSSAGALGWMQFMPSSWRAYGTDANKDGKKDPYNPVDAIFAAARYLNAAGYEKDVKRAVFAYNHADWYVDSVLLRARLIAGVPGDLVGSLTGLTEGRFPVYARSRYADDIDERAATKRVKRNRNAAQLVEGDDRRRGVEIFSRKGAPVVAVNDGVIKEIGKSKTSGRYVVLQDVYGNRYTYSHLGSLARSYPVPKEELEDSERDVKAVSAKRTSRAGAKDPKPKTPASAGRQVDDSDRVRKSRGKGKRRGGGKGGSDSRASAPVKQRLFAHPSRPAARKAGGLDQILSSKQALDGFTTFRNYFSRAFGLDAEDVRLKRLRKGARVIGGTILGRIDKTDRFKAPHLYFEIRPAGRGAPRVDPKPILDGWKLLEATAIYRASGRNALYDDEGDGVSIGQIMLLPKQLLERRVLSDPRIEVYEGGQNDIRSGQIDRRVLATLAYLAESGLKPTVTSLKSGHSVYTSSGNVSHHSSGNAVDIAKINGIPILGHQEAGGITEHTVRRLMLLQGTMKPDQIISLLEMGGPTFAMQDHADHIHVGFRPLFGENRKLGKQALTVLKPGQWNDLIDRLGKIENPVVPTEPSKFALPVRNKERSSGAHRGE